MDRFETIRHYYKSPKFALLDLTYSLVALFSNPYRVCRKFLQKKGAENIYAYGETPFSTYEKIAKEAHLTSDDVWIEMGSGRGRGCFWLAHFMKCQVIGIEWIPKFVHLSQCIKLLFRVKNCTFQKSSIEDAALEKGTLIYLYGLWPEISIPSKAKVITISEPLEDYRVIHSFWVRFPWGRTRCFIQVSKSD